MKRLHTPFQTMAGAGRGSAGYSQRGSVLILVLWVAFGLVSLALYFAQSTSHELKAADQRVAGLQAEYAIQGGLRYLQHYLVQYGTNGLLPDPRDCRPEEVPVGDSLFWFIGRGDRPRRLDEPVFGVVDEASKLNLNTATAAMLEALPGMTPQLAGAIVDWRDADSEPSENGAENEVYARFQPPRRCKNAPFESLEELRLVAGAELEVLFGEDLNLNGVLDPNEDDGDQSPPYDNRDGRLDAGLFEYVTVSSNEPLTLPDGSRRIHLNTGRQELTRLLTEKFGEDRGRELQAALAGGGNFNSVLEFYVRSRMTADEFAQIQTNLTVATGNGATGLINVNTASEAVLSCVPGIGPEKAPGLVAFRMANPNRLNSMAWVTEVLDEQGAIRAGRFLTGESHQFSVDIAAVGRHARGYRRIRYVLDNSGSEPRVMYQRDLTSLGWALGVETRERLHNQRQARR